MITFPLLEKFGSVRRNLNRLAVQRIKPLKLGTKQLIVIRIVSRKPGCSITELAEWADSDLAAVSRMINGLVTAGWLVRSKHPEDARATLIKLGPKGKKKMGEIEVVIKGIHDAFVEALSADETDALLQVLTKIDESLAKEIDG